ncbi:cation:proton antiporter [Arenivirga flava]|uniref:Sodium/hydrogen exchanger n=1 Tax=Arenivirga flava TaxID=1930060 RepID=A0AA37UHZ9_9MICO|nr:sodium:proton antiporter [Arenivirga flava]GMA27567.1 sodium/hydrogen exchanger [Arenivirga flava]
MNGVQLILVIVAAITITGLARRRGLQPALVITVIAIAASFVPGMPRLELDAEIILGVVLPPLLFTAALEFSWRSFVRNLRPILGLGVVLVLVTAAVAGVVAAWLVPALTLGTALILGAIIAPPDAVAAVAVGRELRLPGRLMTILKGESLINDAAALTLFTIAVAAVAGTHTFIDDAVLLFLYSAAVGVVVGVALGLVTDRVRAMLRNAGLETVLGLVLPFAAYLLAEQLEASGVLAVVAAGFVIGGRSKDFHFATRMQERQVWGSVEVLLEAFVFAYMGLQASFVLEELLDDGGSPWPVVGGGLAVLAAVLLIRPLWVFVMFGRRQLSLRHLRRRMDADARFRERFEAALAQREQRGAVTFADWRGLDLRQSAVLSWTGMRGVVTLAAAAGVPQTLADGTPFPARTEIQAIALIVALGTLLLQGATLPWLIRRLGVEDPEEERRLAQQVERAVAVQRDAALVVVQRFGEDPPTGADPGSVDRATRIARRQVEAASTAPDPEQHDAATRVLVDLRRRTLAAQRSALQREMASGALDDEVGRDHLEQLDHQEAALEARAQNRL